MSKASEIFDQYQSSLRDSKEQFEELFRKRREATEKFYTDFFKDLVYDFSAQFANERFRERIQGYLEKNLGTNKLQFIAIDGTCSKQSFADFITFFGGAYGARGEISMEGGEHKLSYKRWSLDQDVSMVAWVPVPFANLEEVTSEETFLMSEAERISLAGVHVQIMQLAEIFLAYNSIRSSRLEAPNVLLMDISPSSVLASVATNQKNIGLVGYPYDRRSLGADDIAVALAHPFSDELGIPSARKMDVERVILAELDKDPKAEIKIKEWSSQLGVKKELLEEGVSRLVRKKILKKGIRGIHPKINVQESWAYVRDFFQNICERLFIRKDPTALQYEAEDADGTRRRFWMSPDDLGFLIGVGMRLLVEECWERKVLFYGIIKDSSSKYLTRNYLGVALETGFYPDLQSLKVNTLPWTDRIFCEILPGVDSKLNVPWATIEFDSAFMTLHREKDEDSGQTKVAGVMGRIVNQERLFARCLGQFFLKRRENTDPLMGHAVFLERLLSPWWDGKNAPKPKPAEISIESPELGKLSVIAWRNNQHSNVGQIIMIYLLSVLTRNHYPEAIGYPDPLHKADCGAKAVGRRAAALIKSSTQLLKADPLSRTFRDTRDSAKR